jgi:hypothetical protein
VPDSASDQLRRNAQAIAALAHAAVQHITHPQLPPDLSDIDCLVLVVGARIADDHRQPFVLERQRRDRRFVGQGEMRRELVLRLGLGRRGVQFRLGGRSDLQGVDSNRLGDVLELGAEIAHRDELDLSVSVLGKADRAQLGDAFEPRRYVHPPSPIRSPSVSSTASPR